MALSELQQQILEAPYNKIVVLAAAASGKTALMTEKVRQLLRAGVDPTTIVVITFTNMAAEELRQRLGEDYRSGLFVGTIHALANYFLLSSGVDTGKLLEEENFDALFELIQDHPSCIKHIDYVVLDEAQDTDEQQFEFLFQMIRPMSFFVCADLRQSIYQWRGAKPKLLEDLSCAEDVHTFDMNENYRNGYNILQFAKRLIAPTGHYDTSVAMRRGHNGAVKEVVYSLETMKREIEANPDYKNWAILTRTNQQIKTIGTFLKTNHIPFDTFRQGDITKDQLTEKMQSNTVKLLTVHSAKGLEWDNVIVVGMMYSSQEERNICYVAATRARETLIWMNYERKKTTRPRTYQW